MTRTWTAIFLTVMPTFGATLGVAQTQDASESHTGAQALPAYNVTDYGAVGDGEILNTDAFAKTISSCAEAGGGTVFVPPGVYVSGPIYLQSNMTLHVGAGATIKGSSRLEDYPEEQKAGWGDGSGESTLSGLVTARDAQHVSIIGRGIIDGSAMAFHDPDTLHGRIVKTYTRQGEDFMDLRFGTEHGPIAHKQRPGNLIRFFNCRDVQLQGVTIQNSPTWTVQFNRCENVDVTGVDINSDDSSRRIPNDDGIDIFNCRKVHISNCDIHTGDDCIAIFGGEALTVVNCTLSSRSSGLRIGFIGGDIRDCVYQNLVIHSSRGISMFVRGADSIENVLFSDIVIRTQLVTGHWWGQAEPIHISVEPWHEQATSLGTISNVRFSNIVAESQSGILVHGHVNSRIRNLRFDHIQLKLKNGPLQMSYGGNFDLRAAKDVTKEVFKHDIPAVYCGYADGLRINGLQVAWDDTLPDFFSHALQIEEARDVVIDGFEGRQPHEKGEAIVLNRVEGISIRDSKATVGTDTFVVCQDVEDARLFTNNDAIGAKKVFQPKTTGFTMSGNLVPGNQ